jgi:uncharacterized protein YbbC (DUF1343 family)
VSASRAPRVRTGLEQLLARPSVLRGLRLGLVANPASVTSRLEHAATALVAGKALRLVTLFGPEHGVFADAQDLVEVGDSKDPRTGLRVFSLYGATRVPTAAMLRGLDAVVFDMQDVGSRYYTYIYTMLHVMEAAAAAGLRVVVLDRPNPLGGERVDGNLLQAGFVSFVGLHPLPVRHGLTVGELALLFREERSLDVDLTVIRMKGWRRSMTFEDTARPWVMTSPNMPTLDTARVYPGGCLVEGTNLSEGRGTTRPFELVGAPWLDAGKLAEDLTRERLPGVVFRPAHFTPTFQKHAGKTCGGVQVHVSDPGAFSAWLAYLLLIFHARAQDERRFAWRRPPYEYETKKLPIDILCGTDAVRRAMDAGRSPRSFVGAWRREASAFLRRREPFLLY